jgi:hypothetical protein
LSDVRTGLNFREFEKTPITFWLHKAGTLKVSVLRQNGEPITSFSLSGDKGLNQFRWDLVLETTRSPQPYFINYKKYLKRGRYRLQLETESKQTMDQDLTVVDDLNPN